MTILDKATKSAATITAKDWLVVLCCVIGTVFFLGHISTMVFAWFALEGTAAQQCLIPSALLGLGGCYLMMHVMYQWVEADQ